MPQISLDQRKASLTLASSISQSLRTVFRHVLSNKPIWTLRTARLVDGTQLTTSIKYPNQTEKHSLVVVEISPMVNFAFF